MQLTHLRWTALGLAPFVLACNMLTPLVFVGEHKKKISAEFDKIARCKVAIVVWTDQATLFDYPYARFELATHVGNKLYAETTQRELGTVIVDPRDVEDFLQKNIDAQLDPEAVGRHFGVDQVIWVEVFRFQIRDPQQPQLLRGKIDASVAVYDLRADPDKPARYELAPVECVYPEGAPIIMTVENSRLARESTYRKFAEQVARKFYEHTVDL